MRAVLFIFLGLICLFTAAGLDSNEKKGYHLSQNGDEMVKNKFMFQNDCSPPAVGLCGGHALPGSLGVKGSGEEVEGEGADFLRA